MCHKRRRRYPINSIILVRHAQSEHHVKELTGGWTDTGLTELGRRQSACLASRLKRELGDTPCQLYCSDLKRALQTAEIIGREIGVTPNPVPELRELNNGVAAGKSLEEAKRYALELTRPVLDWQAYPQAETWRQFYSRVAACMDQLTMNQEDPLLLVTHGGTIINVVAWWLQLDIDMLDKVSFHTSPASLSVLRVNWWNEHTIERLNDTAHLYATGLLSEETRFLIA
jgi:broad specificity phosphatase PhoE